MISKPLSQALLKARELIEYCKKTAHKGNKGTCTVNRFAAIQTVQLLVTELERLTKERDEIQIRHDTYWSHTADGNQCQCHNFLKELTTLRQGYNGLREAGKEICSACREYIEHNEDWPNVLDAVKQYEKTVSSFPAPLQ